MAKLSYTAAEIDALLGRVSPLETEVDENRAALAEVIDSGQKNILQSTATSAEVNGVTFTANSDGSVTATGTATANADFTISNLTGYPTSGRYILSGCPEGGGASTYRVQIYQVAADYGSAVEFTSQNRLNVYIRISAGQTVDGLVFRPMICSKAAWAISQEYVPYRSNSGGGGATIKTLTYTGDGGTTTTINFPDTPSVVLSIDGPETGTGMVNLTSFRFGAKAVSGSWSDSQTTSSTKANGIFLLADTNNNTLLLSGGQNVGSRCNVNGATYTVTYI